MSAGSLPSGTVTFLFTDVEGSTRLLERLGDAYGGALLEHRRALRSAFGAEGGVEVDTQGDAFFFAFASAGAAAAAALAGVRALEPGPIRVRIGIHTGEPMVTGEGYVGMDVHRGARIAASGHGGQVLVSEQTQKLLGGREDLRDLGYHRLKDMRAAERIFQLGEGEFAPLKSLNQTNLPVQPTPFLGRQDMLAGLLALLRRDDVRLVTLTGPGGTGKTRLGFQAAAELVEGYPDGGVWVAALAPITEVDLVLPTILQALGLRDAAGEGALDTIARHVRDRSTLLVVDNVEHLLPAAADELGALLGACRGLNLLVTSRESLRLSAEHEFPVPPLASLEAVRLFVERARAARPDFVLDAAGTGAVAAVCARLDGLPLAVELAAARVKVLSPQALLTRLEQRLPLLVGGARDAPERQRTLRGAIAWSHDLLPADERRVFALLAVFSGGWTLEAAEDVCGASIDQIGALIDKSLIVCSDPGAENPRYTMLETIREYALERLEDMAEAAAHRRRHAEFYGSLAEHAEIGLKGRDQASWLERLEAEHDNLRSSLEWAISEDHALAVRLAADLWLFWYMHGHVSEGRGWLARVLAVADGAPSRARAKALDGAGYLAGEQNDAEPERALLEASLQCARELGLPEDVATAACHLAGGFLHDDPARALGLAEEAVALARTAGSRYVLAMALNNLGGVAYALKMPEREFFEESYRLRLEAGDVSRIALSLINLAECARDDGDTSEARRLLADALERAQQIGDRRHVCLSLEGLGWVALAGGDFAEARDHLVRCLELARALGQVEIALATLHGLAGAAAGSGDVVRAARLMSAAAAHRGLVRNDPAERNGHLRLPELEAARAGSLAWDTAWHEGARMSLDDAFDYALEQAAAESD